MTCSEEDILLELGRFNLVVLNQYVLPDHFDRIEVFCLHVLSQEHLAESASAQLNLDFEVFEPCLLLLAILADKYRLAAVIIECDLVLVNGLFRFGLSGSHLVRHAEARVRLKGQGGVGLQVTERVCCFLFSLGGVEFLAALDFFCLLAELFIWKCYEAVLVFLTIGAQRLLIGQIDLQCVFSVEVCEAHLDHGLHSLDVVDSFQMQILEIREYKHNFGPHT